MSNEEQKIEEHRQMVILSGKLSDFQMKNLNMWPLVVFEKESLGKVTIDYDFTEQPEDEKEDERIAAGKIAYNIDFTNELFYDENEVGERIEHIRKWVKHLFWEDTQVKFNLTQNGEKWGD